MMELDKDGWIEFGVMRANIEDLRNRFDIFEKKLDKIQADINQATGEKRGVVWIIGLVSSVIGGLVGHFLHTMMGK